MARKTVYFEESERKIFNTDSPTEDILIPVPVIPGTIPPPNMVSPYTITE